MYPLYKIVLAAPHADKEASEAVIIKALEEPSPVFSGFAVVRPSLLLDGESQGLKAIRMGWEKNSSDLKDTGTGPVIGYTINRADVGIWIFENMVKEDPMQWNERYVTITY